MASSDSPAKSGEAAGGANTNAGASGGSSSVCRNGPGDTVTMDPRTVRLAFEIRGVGSLSEMMYANTAAGTTMHLKRVMQDAKKCTRRGKRLRTSMSDVHRAICRHDTKYIPFVPDMEAPTRQGTVGGKAFYYEEDREIDVSSLLTKELEKVPCEVSLRNHWLVIEGRQPAVPENPAPESVEEQTEKSLNPASGRANAFGSGNAANDSSNKLERPKSLWEVLHGRFSLNGSSSGGRGPASRYASGPELALFKEVKNHDLSVEQQVFYREITEACVGSSEEKRLQSLNSLATDGGLHQILPRLITFIVEGIRVNTVQSNLALLIYLVRMLKALLENSHLYLDKYLHEIIPACITCITCRQLCLRPESDNHWALRDFAAKQLSIICQKYTNPSYQIGPRVCMVLSSPLHNPTRAPLGSLYGAISGMIELGAEVVRTNLIPSLVPVCSRLTELMAAIEEMDRGQSGMPPGMIGDRMGQISSLDRRAVDQIQILMLSRLPAVLKNYPLCPNEDEDEYIKTFGSVIGPKMYSAVLTARQQPNKPGQQATGITCLKPRRRTRVVPTSTSAGSSNTPATAPSASSNLKQMRLAANRSMDHGVEVPKQVRLTVPKSEPVNSASTDSSRPGNVATQRRIIVMKDEGSGLS